MKSLILRARILWLRHRINQLNAEIAKEQAQIEFWDKQNTLLADRIAELKAAQS